MEVTIFLTGCTLLSLILSYAIWCKFRTIILRERLFLLRDGIFDEATDRGRLDDEAYREVRRIINQQIRFAHFWNIAHLIALITAKVEHYERPQSTDAEFNFLLETAMDELSTEIANHLIKRTVGGWVVLAIAATLIGPARLWSWAAPRVRCLVEIEPDCPDAMIA